jgi:hypothetical protein
MRADTSFVVAAASFLGIMAATLLFDSGDTRRWVLAFRGVLVVYGPISRGWVGHFDEHVVSMWHLIYLHGGLQ